MASETKEKASKDWGIIKKKDNDGNDAFYARIIRYDGNGKKKQYTAKADNKSHARRLRKELEDKYDKRGEKAIEGDKMRFRELADLYEKRRLIPAEYHGKGTAKRKIAGVRSLAPSKHYIKILREYFGTALIRNIRHSEIEDFKAIRLKTKSIRGERSIADVNRTLELLRAILRFAVRNHWLFQSPFETGSPLISKADEVKRERTLTFNEENLLLANCTGEREIKYMWNGKEITITRKIQREHIKDLIITALDTAMRKGELLKLRWKDVNFPMCVITVTAMNSKTAKAREIGMTPRVRELFENRWNQSPKDENELVFGIKDNFKNGFNNACNDANITDLRFHDLRHTAITRMVNAGLPPMEIMKVSGHTQWTTFARYVNPTTQTVKKIANVLSDYNSTNIVISEQDFLN